MNATIRTASDLGLLHQMIERQVDRGGDASALTWLGQELSYRDLDRWANCLANRLVQVGAGPETPIVVIADRRPETVVALLAVLKAGGAYVPVDPGTPPHRFNYLMRDSGARIVVAADADSVPPGDWTAVCSAQPSLANESDANPSITVHTDNTAYVIYTSGSTGEPKGVVVSHRQVVAATTAHMAYDRPAPASFLLLVSFSFDACAVGLYWTLATGGHLVLPSTEQMADPGALRGLAAHHRITHLDCTPTMYSHLLGDDPAPFRTLRCAIVGGEQCRRELVERHHRWLPECLLINNYGPTETTVWATTATLTNDGPDAPVPIGAAIPGAHTYVLDDDFQPSSHGELFIGGSGVARGYHGRPRLTSNRFLPDPWSETAGARMYRTGDMVHVLPDGSLEFLGRVDHQVKVRGYRIELGEVENAICEHPLVAECAADVRDIGGTTALVGWLTGQPDGTLEVDDVRSFLSGHLPDYMVPSRFLVIDEMPRNVAGKVDRTLLPEPTPIVGADGPTTPLEAEVAELASEVLGLSQIGRNDSFFDLGGTSLHVSRLMLGVWSRFQVSVPIHQLFQIPTVTGIAQIIEAARRLNDPNAIETWTAQQLDDACQLDASIRPDDLPSADWSRPRNILLTGSTGYLGAFLLKELIERTDATVWCLVRADSAKHGRERIRSTMNEYLIWQDSYNDRFVPVLGDLTKPRLGMDTNGYADLCERTDSIYHCAALVNFLYPYSEIKPPNVDGTAEILRLATTRTLKALHYISTIDMFLETDMDRPYVEDMEMIANDVPEGYARSKWIAEAFVRTARQRGVPCSIYRPGMLLSHTETGATQLNDYLIIELKGLLQFGVVPEVHYMFDAVPVDYASRAIAHISLQKDSLGDTFHLWNLHPVQMKRIYQWIRTFGYALDIVSFETVIQHLVTVTPDNAIFPLVPLFLDEEHRLMPEAFEPEVMANTDLRAECRNTLAMLEGSGIECPPMTEELAHRCFRYLVDVGFFPTPDEQRSRMREHASVPDRMPQ